MPPCRALINAVVLASREDDFAAASQEAWTAVARVSDGVCRCGQNFNSGFLLQNCGTGCEIILGPKCAAALNNEDVDDMIEVLGCALCSICACFETVGRFDRDVPLAVVDGEVLRNNGFGPTAVCRRCVMKENLRHAAVVRKDTLFAEARQALRDLVALRRQQGAGPEHEEETDFLRGLRDLIADGVRGQGPPPNKSLVWSADSIKRHLAARREEE